jgi:hypothetical protein
VFKIDGKSIEWHYVEKLYARQEANGGLCLANKLTNEHIDFENHKMVVKYASQLFSASVANAIDHCR